MKHCELCKIDIAQDRAVCPICGSELTGTIEKDTEYYPNVTKTEKLREPFPLLAKIFLFVSIIISVVVAFLNCFIAPDFPWAVITIGAIVVLWAAIGIPLLSRMNVNAMLLVQLLAAVVYFLLIDRLTGSHGWALTYVVPGLYIAMLIAAVTLTLVFHDHWRDYLLPLIGIGAVGIIPLLSLTLRWVKVKWLCLSAVTLMLALFIGLIIFAGRRSLSEMRRKLHL